MSFFYQLKEKDILRAGSDSCFSMKYYWYQKDNQYIIVEWDYNKEKFNHTGIVSDNEIMAIQVCEALNDYEGF